MTKRRFSLLLLFAFAFSSPLFSTNQGQKTKLVLYYSPYCIYCKHVLTFLKQIEKHPALKNVEKDPNARDELLYKGGKRQVPCLFINGKPLYESKDIIDWLAAHQDEI